MAKGFKAGAGGGAPLNFKVVGNPQPASPKENTIWVNTDVPIGAWHFSTTQPENMAEGDVWFSVGIYSTVEFNALKKNGIQVYPLYAKQYVGGALVKKESKSYQNGEWVKWVTWLYKDGEFFEDLTGSISRLYTSATASKLTYNETNINLVSNGGNGIYAFANLFDLSGKSKLCFEYTLSGSGNYACEVRVTSKKSVTSFSDGLIAKKTLTSATSGVTKYEIDISSVDSGYIGFSGTIGSSSNSFNFTIYKMWLE